MKRVCMVLMAGMTLLVLPGIALSSKISSPVSLGKVEIIKGDAYVVRHGERQTLGLGDSLYPRDTIMTAGSGRAKLSFDDGSAVFVAENSQVGIEHYSVKYGYRMSGHFNALRGKIRFIVTKVDGLDANFSVQTKSAKIRVTGTDFTVVEPAGMSPTQVLLHSGQIVARTKIERGFVMKPGQIAQFVSNGEIIVRNITSQDIASLDVPIELTAENSSSEQSGSDQRVRSGSAGANEKAGLFGEPKIKEPKIKEPKIKEPKIKEPKIKEPKIKEPKIKVPKIKEPKIKEPKIKEPKIKEPKIKVPKIKEPKIH